LPWSRKLGKRKAKVQQGGLWCKTRANPETLPTRENPEKQGNEGNADENEKCENLNSPKQFIRAEHQEIRAINGEKSYLGWLIGGSPGL